LRLQQIAIRGRSLVTYATNRRDGAKVYFEDDGGEAPAVVFHGGILDTVELVRGSPIARGVPREFRHIYVDHRGLGRSDKPHEAAAYAMPVRVGDAVAVLDELAISRACFIGASWGGRLGFGIGEHAPQRVLSLEIGGQQPYATNRDGPIVRAVTDGVVASRAAGIEALIAAFERISGAPFPDEQRRRYLEHDPAAIDAAWNAALDEGTIVKDLSAWRVRCLIYAAVADADFFDQARQAASEIPDGEFLSLEGLDHLGAHFQSGPVLPAVLRLLRASD
jgi:pimeloyl-ACP methyl ester carboxylesterase